ncbi:helix-turn-helix domain-containing protein [Vagococcus hydrophili]|uniref:Helix-turn-helix transcriptional regulator n=1 Tax=Vagococcus hydrophili TaxID=2714947 RepID=A0A6G8ATD0_9ENTE|nr:helix-turn-helix transcriptional regulator [Vagococcus hydrophili]QIL48195.1 helix-turn-helix transcriptional regulator [Vagococcus hydrophili]
MERIIININKAIDRSGVTHEELSKKMELSRSYVTMILKGERKINKELVVCFSEALSLSVEELFSFDLDQEYEVRTRGEFKTRASKNKLAKLKVRMDDYLRLKGMYENEYID